MNIKKTIRRALENKKDEFFPTCVSIHKLCKKANNLSYFDQIYNRIQREYEKDEKLGDFIRIDFTNGFDILLDEDGIMLFLDILEGYFDRNQILSLAKYLRESNKLRRMEYQFDHIFDHLPTEELRKVLDNYENMIVEPKDEEARQIVINKAKSDIKKRNRLVYLADFKKVEGVI